MTTKKHSLFDIDPVAVQPFVKLSETESSLRCDRTPQPPRDYIDELVGALVDPIIVFPGGGWEDTIPEKLKQDLPLQRLAHNMLCLQGKEKWDEACDLEALIYLYPASLTAPMSSEWSKIYLYLGTKYMGKNFPEDIRQESLSDYEMGELRDLKRWIYKKRVEGRRARRKGDQALQKGDHKASTPSPVEAKYEQMKLF